MVRILQWLEFFALCGKLFCYFMTQMLFQNYRSSDKCHWNIYLKSHWKPKVLMMPTLSSMTTNLPPWGLGFQCNQTWCDIYGLHIRWGKMISVHPMVKGPTFCRRRNFVEKVIVFWTDFHWRLFLTLQIDDRSAVTVSNDKYQHVWGIYLKHRWPGSLIYEF